MTRLNGGQNSPHAQPHCPATPQRAVRRETAVLSRKAPAPSGDYLPLFPLLLRCRAFARGWTLKPQRPSFPKDDRGSNPALKQPPHAHAAHALGGSMLLGASKQRNAIFCAMSAAVCCDGPEGDRARRLQRAAGERSGAVRGNSATPPLPSSHPKHAFHGLEWQ